MAKGYLIFTEDVRDEATLQEKYIPTAIQTIMQAGGRILVVHDDPEILEGNWRKRTIVVEFDSVDDARNWYNLPEYQAVIPIRQGAADGELVIVAGFEPPSS